MDKPGSIILLSGGLDSVVTMASLVEQSEIVFALTFDYGQFSAKQEIRAAHAVSALYSVDHKVIPLLHWQTLPEIPLVSNINAVPTTDKTILDNGEKSMDMARSVWVPNRNGVFINIAAVYAEVYHADMIGVGFNAEEGASFPDNSREFMDAINQSLKYSCLNDTRVVCPTSELSKHEIVELGLQLDAPLHLIYSCYRDNDLMCGTCPSCIRCKEAFITAGKFHIIKDRFQNEIQVY